MRPCRLPANHTTPSSAPVRATGRRSSAGCEASSSRSHGARYRTQGRTVRALALVVGSVIDPASIGNDHIRAHALEGQLFRTALERAAQSARVACATHVERGLYDAAAARLKRTPAELRRVVAQLGRTLEGPWRADEKTATLAAWMVLARSH